MSVTVVFIILCVVAVPLGIGVLIGFATYRLEELCRERNRRDLLAQAEQICRDAAHTTH